MRPCLACSAAVPPEEAAGARHRAPWACLAAPNKRSSQVTSEGRCCCCQRRAPPLQRGCDRRAILSLWRLDVFCGKDVPTWLLSSRTQTPARSQPPAAAPSGPGPGAPTSTSAPGQAPLCRWWPGGQSRVPRPPEAGVGRWRCGQFLCSLRQAPSALQSCPREEPLCPGAGRGGGRAAPSPEGPPGRPAGLRLRSGRCPRGAGQSLSRVPCSLQEDAAQLPGPELPAPERSVRHIQAPGPGHV